MSLSKRNTKIFSNFLPLPEFKPSLEEKQEKLLNYRPKNPVYLQEIIKFDFFKDFAALI